MAIYVTQEGPGTTSMWKLFLLLSQGPTIYKREVGV